MAEPARNLDTPDSAPEGHGVPSSEAPTAVRRRKSADSVKIQANTEPTSACKNWLNWQCKMIAGVQSGAIYDSFDDKLRSVKACWPDSSESRTVLAKLASEVSNDQHIIVRTGQKSQTGASSDLIAMPVKRKRGYYVVALRLNSRSEAQLQAVVQLLQWGGIWLGSMDTVAFQQAAPKLESAPPANDSLLTSVLEQDCVHSVCMEIVNTVALKLDCERVSVGLVRNTSIRMQAISQLVNFDARRQIVSAIEEAMEEAVEQSLTLLMPLSASCPDTEQSAMPMTDAHRRLQKLSGCQTSLTLPLVHNSDVIGAVLLEGDDRKAFNSNTSQQAETLLTGIAPLLALQISNERSSIDRLVHSFSRRRMVFLKKEKRKKAAVVTGLCLLLCGIALFPMTHRVVANATIEGADKQVLVASQSGYIKSANFRAGDRVKAGQELAVLDDRDLQIERNKWIAELSKLDTSYAQALGTRQRSEMGLVQARKQQVAAELALVNQKLQRGILRAPFDGVLVSGDLNQSLGAPVEVGETLFEIASLQSYRLMLEVEEHDVAGIQSGQSGSLRIAALPGRTYQATLKSVVPVAITRESGSVFRLEAALEETSDVLHPGMQGVAKIEVGKRALFWVMTHSVVDRVNLWLWKVGVL